MRIQTFIPVIALALLLGGSSAYAQTSSTTVDTTYTASTTPGTPNTGAGGNAAENVLMLVGTGVVAFLGAVYLLGSRA